MTTADYTVIVFYMLFILSIGFVFRKFSSNINDYFRGGGSIQWWMLGASVFMIQFSAATFTAFAGRAYTMGIFLLAGCGGTVLGYFFNYLGVAERLRQLRVMTNADAVRLRYGRGTEQFFVCIGFITGFFGPAVWLYALAIFVSSMFGMDLRMVTIITGCVVVFMSSAGGSWAVIASDFMQAVILVFICLTTTVLMFMHPDMGGISGFIEKAPSELFTFSKMGTPMVIYGFLIFIFIKQVVAANNIADAYRYVAAKDSKHAKRAALLAMILLFFNPVLTMLPAMGARIFYPDIASVFPGLKNPEEAAYVATAMKVLPAGMLGLMVSGIFAATMSCMDTGLNSKAAVLIKNFYLPNIRPKASDKELLLAGKIVTVALGGVIILLALFIDSVREMTLFDLYMIVSSAIGMPFLVPIFYGIFIKKTPNWSGWGTVIFAFMVALLIMVFLKGNEQAVATSFFGLGELSKQDINDFYFVWFNVIVFALGSAFYFSSMLFYKKHTTEQLRKERDDLFVMMKKPIAFDEEEGVSSIHDAMQFKVLGILALVFAAFVLSLLVIPNDLKGRMAYLFCGGGIGSIGLLLLYNYRKIKKEEDAAGIHEKELEL